LEYKAIPVMKEGEQREAEFLSDIRSARFRFWWITTYWNSQAFWSILLISMEMKIGCKRPRINGQDYAMAIGCG